MVGLPEISRILAKCRYFLDPLKKEVEVEVDLINLNKHSTENFQTFCTLTFYLLF